MKNSFSDVVIPALKRFFSTVALGLFFSLLCSILLGLIFSILVFCGTIGRTPKVGEVYHLKSDNNPFKPLPTSTILCLKKGWVLYSYTNDFGTEFTNSMTLTSWRQLYIIVK